MQIAPVTSFARPAVSVSRIAALVQPKPANVALSAAAAQIAPSRLEAVAHAQIERASETLDPLAQRARQIAATFLASGLTTNTLASAASLIGAMIASGQPAGGAGQPSLAQIKAAIARAEAQAEKTSAADLLFAHMAYVRKAAIELANENGRHEPVSIAA